MTPASRAHADVLARLHALSFAGTGTEPWEAVAFMRLLDMPGTAGWIVRLDGGGPAGLILVRVAGDEAEIITLGVIPEARSQGLGEKLVATAEDWARAGAAERLILEVAVDNAPAIGLYERAGFACSGRRPNYYKREKPEENKAIRVDALVMVRQII